MPPEAQCVHRTPVRFRVRIPSKKGDKAFFAYLQAQLAQCEAVTATLPNPVTGGLLISHTGDMLSIVEYAERNKLFRLERAKNNPGSVAHATVTTYKTLDAQIKRLSGSKLDVAHTAFLTLVGAGIYQISRGRLSAPAWYTAFWYALNIFLKAQHK